MSVGAAAELDFREVNILTWHSRQLTVANAGDIGCRVRVDVCECRHADGGAAPQVRTRDKETDKEINLVTPKKSESWLENQFFTISRKIC